VLVLFTIAYCTSFVLGSLQCLCCTFWGIHVCWMLHFNIGLAYRYLIIQNLQTYKNYHLLISINHLGKILQGKCFAASIISHHLHDSFSIQWTKLFVAFVMTVLLFFSIQSFLRNWMEFEFHVVLCRKCQNLNVSHIKTDLPNTILQHVHWGGFKKTHGCKAMMFHFISCIPAFTIDIKHIPVIIMYTAVIKRCKVN